MLQHLASFRAVPWWLVLLQAFTFCRQASKPDTPMDRTASKPAARVTQVIHLPDIPSASGVEVVGDRIYLIGDDSPYLYRLDRNYKQLEPVLLFPTDQFESGRIPKHLKPDLEAFTALEFNGEPHLLAMGSGTTPARSRGFLISLADDMPTVMELQLRDLYDALRKSPEVVRDGELNIEGLAASDTDIYLVQRGVGGAANTLVTIPKTEFEQLFTPGSGGLINPVARELPIPVIGKIKGGYSGIIWYAGHLFLTASVEDTHDPILDGAVSGSFVCYLPHDQATIQLQLITDAKGKPMEVKMESISILEKLEEGHYKAISVTDNDLGQSEVLELDIRLPLPDYNAPK